MERQGLENRKYEQDVLEIMCCSYYFLGVICKYVRVIRMGGGPDGLTDEL